MATGILVWPIDILNRECDGRSILMYEKSIMKTLSERMMLTMALVAGYFVSGTVSSVP